MEEERCVTEGRALMLGGGGVRGVLGLLSCFGGSRGGSGGEGMSSSSLGLFFFSCAVGSFHVVWLNLDLGMS